MTFSCNKAYNGYCNRLVAMTSLFAFMFAFAFAFVFAFVFA
jgi:hypothetical protein